MSGMRRIEVVDYDPAWPAVFERLRTRIWPAVSDLAAAIEHIGSTSVPGLAAKPIVDMTIVVPTPADVPLAIARLAGLGYVHRGDLGIEGREAFRNPLDLPRHHLYLCPSDNLGLRNSLAVRDYLRVHPEATEGYGALKKRLAVEFRHDIEGYIAGKTEFLLEILRATGFSPAEIDAIAAANRLSLDMRARRAEPGRLNAERS
jgi:GrpB-like predicted nucleotidyltransferase (UPF0157 family)